jgi:hypothetical protein
MIARNEETVLEHDPEKWKPVFRIDHAQSKRRDHDAISCNRIMVSGREPKAAAEGGLDE